MCTLPPVISRCVFGGENRWRLSVGPRRERQSHFPRRWDATTPGPALTTSHVSTRGANGRSAGTDPEGSRRGGGP